jgi:hypothetical protein
VLVQPRLVFLRKAFAQQCPLFGESIEYTPLAVDPTQIPGAEEAIEETMGNFLGR